MAEQWKRLPIPASNFVTSTIHPLITAQLFSIWIYFSPNVAGFSHLQTLSINDSKCSRIVLPIVQSTRSPVNFAFGNTVAEISKKQSNETTVYFVTTFLFSNLHVFKYIYVFIFSLKPLTHATWAACPMAAVSTCA